MNHRAACDSALTPQEAGPHADARDGPGSQAVAGRKQEAPPSQASGLPLGVSPGTPRLLDPPLPQTARAHLQGPAPPGLPSLPAETPIWNSADKWQSRAGVPPRAPSWLNKHGCPPGKLREGQGSRAGIAGRRAEHGNAGRAWWLQGLALPVGALRAQVCRAGGDLWGIGAGRALTGAQGPTGESGGRLSYVAQHFAIPRPPPPGAIPGPLLPAAWPGSGQMVSRGPQDTEFIPRGSLKPKQFSLGATGDQCGGLNTENWRLWGPAGGGGRGGGGEPRIQPEYAWTATGKHVSDEMHRTGDKWPPGLGAGDASGPMSSKQRNLLILMRRGGALTGEGVSTPRMPPGPPVSSPGEPNSRAHVQSSPHTCPGWGLSNQSPASLAHTSCHFP